MTRIDELQKKYSALPRDAIVKYELMNRGVRDTDDLDKVSRWTGAVRSYQSYDHDVTLKEMVKKRPERLRPGYTLVPAAAYMSSGLGVKIMRHTKSPYTVREIAEDRFAVFEGEEKVDADIYFPRPKPRTTEEPVTSKGTAVGSVVTLNRRCFFIFPVRYCEYFASGEECRFCNFNLSQEDARSIGVDRPVTVSLDEVVEAYKITSSEVRLIEGKLEMGGFMSSEKESNTYASFVEKVANGAPYKPNLTIFTQTMDRKDMQRLRDVGLDCITFQLEVWDPQIFAEVCPGKAKHAPHERWVESFLEAVDVFGAGHVGTTLIAGVTLVPPNGHRTWQEARDCHIEGNRWLIEHGVMPTMANLRLPPGSVYGANELLREKVPPTEYILDVATAHHEAMTECGLYQKLNKFMHCGLDCTTLYTADLGILAIAGDFGNWMADVVPYESNWIAQFLLSIESPAESKASSR